MNVFILIDWFLPAYKGGGPIQSIANLVSQPLEGITYKIVCSNKDLDKSILDVKADQWTVFNPWTQVYYSSKGINRKLLGSENDLLFINGIYSPHYNLVPILFSKARQKVVSARGMVNTEAIAQKSFKKKIFLRLWNLAGINKRVEFHAASKQEAWAIKSVFGQEIKVHFAKNYPRNFQQQPLPRKKRGELNLVSVALISPMKNILLVLEALRLIPERIEYDIFGPVKEAAYWEECLATIRTLPSHISVRYRGDLKPQEVEEALRSSHVFILPSKFENFCHAIYEALTAGKPVITSHHTPWNGLADADAGQNVSPEVTGEIAAAISFFAAMDQAEIKAWSDGAILYAEKAVNLEEIKAQYRAMFRLSRKPATPVNQPD